MAHIDDVPEAVTAAGQDHDYETFGTATVVLVNAPVDPDHVNAGVNRAAYNAFIDAEIVAGRAFQRDDLILYDPRHPIDLDINFYTAARYNYARVAIGTDFWYLFLDPPEFVNLHTTRFRTTIDPWATYDWALGYSMIRRAHAAVAASQGDTYGDAYCMAPEPIDAPPVRGVLAADVIGSGADDWTIMVISANDLRGHPTDFPYFERHVEEDEIQQAAARAAQSSNTSAGSPQFAQALYEVEYPWQMNVGGEMRIYVPSVTPSPTSTVDGIPKGGGAYLFTTHGWEQFRSVIAAAPWVVEGISEIHPIPSWAVSGGGDGTITVSTPPESPGSAAWTQARNIPTFRDHVTTSPQSQSVLAGWRDTFLASVGASQYRKLITSPYTRVLIGNGNGTTDYQPEQMKTSGVDTVATTGAAHGEASVRLTPTYNLLGEQQSVEIPYGGSLGYHTSGYGRAAGNTASADLGPVNSAYTNVTQREVVTRQQALALELSQTEKQMNMGLLGVQTVMNAGVGAGMGAMGGPAGAAAGALVGGGTALVTAGISNNNSLDILDISQNGSVNIAGYQLGASGLFNALSFRAWVQGLQAVSGRASGENLASAWRAVTGQAFKVIVAVPAEEKIRELLSMWRRYGYMIGRAFKPSRLDVMTRFSYWQTEGATVTGAVPQTERQSITAAFDRGVTVWNQLDMIGTDQTGANAPVSGVSY